MIPEKPDDENMLLDACIAFYPDFFKKCPTMERLKEKLKENTYLDFHLEKDKIPNEWYRLRQEAKPIFKTLNIFKAELTLSETMKNDFDDKQIKIIKAWYTKAEEAKKQRDWYSAFISLWISFNAFCYGKYEKDANKIRVDIDKYTDIFNEQEEVIIKGIAEKKSSKDIIKIDEP
jgi:hypothetical protein